MSKRIASVGFLLFIITAVSKVAAFIVTIVFSHYFGTDPVTDAYYAAGTIPNLVNNSLTICALTLFVPVYTRCRSREEEGAADRFAANILNSFILFNIVLFIAVSITSPFLSDLVAPGFDSYRLAHTQKMICLLSMSFPFTVGAVSLNNLYNANQKYILPAILTLLNHVFIIVFNILLAPRFGIYSYPFICTVAWCIQFIVLFFVANNNLFKYGFIINIRDEYFNFIIIQSIPVMIATAADQINLAADNIISSDLPGGALSCLGYSHRIFNSINGLVSATLLTLYYPILSAQYANNDQKGLHNTIRKYLDVMLLMTLPLSLLLIGNAQGIIDVLFNHGVMREHDIVQIATLFTIYVSGMLFLSIKEFATRLFYIMGDTKSPTVINAGCVAMNIVMSLSFKHYIGVYGIALATTIATLVCSLIESRVLIRRIGGLASLKEKSLVNIKATISTLVSCAIAFCTMKLCQKYICAAPSIWELIISGICFGVALLLALLIMRNEYVLMLIKKVCCKRIGEKD